MAQEIIRCPHCGAAYRVTRQMREHKGSKARCVGCSEIFDWSVDGESPAAPPKEMPFSAAPTEKTTSRNELYIAPPAPQPQNSNIKSIREPVQESAPEKHPEVETTDEPTPDEEHLDAVIANLIDDKPAEQASSTEEATRIMPLKPDTGSMPRPPMTQPEHREIVTNHDEHVVDQRSTGRWLVASIILLLALAAQVVWLFRGHESIYPLLEQACDQIDCRLPEMRDVDKLRITKRLFSAVENKAGVYRLQLQLGNEAPFPQQYPTIELSLIDSRGIVRARKKLLAKEYLPDFRPDWKLASMTKSDFSFTIQSPATETSGFELKFF